jgi:hypothetical protein
VVWLSQKSMGEQFKSSSEKVGLHLKNIFKEGELNPASVAEEFSATEAGPGVGQQKRLYKMAESVDHRPAGCRTMD